MCLPDPPERASTTLTRRGLLAGAAALAVVRPWWRRAGTAQPVEVAPGLAIWPRERWAQGREPTGALQPEDVRFLLVHHTAGANDLPASRVPRELQQIYDFHTGPSKGWPDVCYNFFVDAEGGVWEGRAGSLDGPVMADATAGSQGFAQLVCLLGDFTSVMPTDAALASLTAVLAWLADRHAIDTSPGATVDFVSRGSNKWPAGAAVTAATISGHRDMTQTACPGDAFYPYVHDGLQGAVDALRGTGRSVATPVPTAVAPSTAAPTPVTTAAPRPTSPPSTPAPTVARTTTTTAVPATVSPPTAPPPTTIASTTSSSTTSSTTRPPGVAPVTRPPLGSAADAAPGPRGAGAAPVPSNDGGGSSLPIPALLGATVAVAGAGFAVARVRRAGNDKPPQAPPPPAGGPR